MNLNTFKFADCLNSVRVRERERDRAYYYQPECTLNQNSICLIFYECILDNSDNNKAGKLYS